jgi:hypothetical protein
MAGTALVTTTPSKRFIDADENLAVADLNAMGLPLFQLGAGSVGTDELITDDVTDMISEQLLGLRVSYTFPAAYSLPNTGTALEIAKVTLTGVRQGDPVWCQQLRLLDGSISTLSVEMDAQVSDVNTVSIRAIPVGAAVVIPFGATVMAVVFSARRHSARGAAGGSPNPLETDTGYLTVTPGFVINLPDPGRPAAGINPAMLDALAQPTATVAPDSIGRREIDPASLEDITASVVGGVPFNYTFPTTISIPGVGGGAVYAITVASAVTTQAAVMGNRPSVGFDPIKWLGTVSVDGTVVVTAHNMTASAQIISKGQTISGRLI